MVYMAYLKGVRFNHNRNHATFLMRIGSFFLFFLFCIDLLTLSLTLLKYWRKKNTFSINNASMVGWIEGSLNI